MLCKLYPDSKETYKSKHLEERQGEEGGMRYVSILFLNSTVNEDVLIEFHSRWRKLLDEGKDVKVNLRGDNITWVEFALIRKHAKFMAENAPRSGSVIKMTRIYTGFKGSLLLNTLFTLRKPAGPYEIHRV